MTTSGGPVPPSHTAVPALPRRGEGCPPPGVLEALSVEDGQGTEPEAWNHLAGCRSCQGYVDALHASARAFHARHPRERFLLQVEARRLASARAAAARRGRRWVGALGLAAAAAGVLVLVGSRSDVDPLDAAPYPAQDVRWKGASVSVYLQREGEAPRVVSPGEVLRPNDSIRFAVRSEGAAYAVVLGRDGEGRVSVLAPFGASGPQRVGPGTTWLDDSAVLDASRGPEEFVAVMGPAPFELGALLRELQAEPSLAALAKVACEGCTVRVLGFEKAKPR